MKRLVGHYFREYGRRKGRHGHYRHCRASHLFCIDSSGAAQFLVVVLQLVPFKHAKVVAECENQTVEELSHG